MKLTKEWIDEFVPALDPDKPYPIDEELHHCEFTLMKERNRVRSALFHLLEGLDN